MYLAFDTETTDLPRSHLDPDHPHQPHLLQFAGILIDEHNREIDRLFTKVRPGVGAVLSSQAYAAHGITLEEAFHQGMEAIDVFRWFAAAAARSDRIVGHNVQFDLQIMAIVAARAGLGGWSTPVPTYCTMAHATPVVDLPPTPRMRAAGRLHPKSPSLAECITHFFAEELTDAHDAEADVRACLRIFRRLNRRRPVA